MASEIRRYVAIALTLGFFVLAFDSAAQCGPNSPILTGEVRSIAGVGDKLFVGGSFTDAAGNPDIDGIAVWDTSTHLWSNLGAGLSGPRTGASSQAANARVDAIVAKGSDLFVGGSFARSGDLELQHIARWSLATNSWSKVGPAASVPGGLNGEVNAIAVQGNAVFMGGRFTFVEGVGSAAGIAIWDDASKLWVAPGTRAPSGPSDLAVDPTTQAIFASNDSTSLARLSRFTAGSSAWEYVLRNYLPTFTRSLIVSPAGDLFLGGGFCIYGQTSNMIPLTNCGVGRVNGDVVVPVGLSVVPDWISQYTSSVEALAFFKDKIVAAGRFKDNVPNSFRHNIAQLDYSARLSNDIAWTSVGSGVNNLVNVLSSQGNLLYLGGTFTDAGGDDRADYIAAWDGSSYSGLTLPCPPSTPGSGVGPTTTPSTGGPQEAPAVLAGIVGVSPKRLRAGTKTAVSVRVDAPPKSVRTCATARLSRMPKQAGLRITAKPTRLEIRLIGPVRHKSTFLPWPAGKLLITQRADCLLMPNGTLADTDGDGDDGGPARSFQVAIRN